MNIETVSPVQADNRPCDYEYALISKHAYLIEDSTLEVGKTFQTPFRKWKISFIRSVRSSGYFGAVYECQSTRQYVVAHRGTNSGIDLFEDYFGIFKNRCSMQKSESFSLVSLMVEKIKQQATKYNLSFTGHSLGGFLAELSVIFATVVLKFPSVSAVTFESPGSRDSMFNLCWHPTTLPGPISSSVSCSSLEIEGGLLRRFSISMPSIEGIEGILGRKCSRISSSSTDISSIIENLDIISYLAYPNIVNITNLHVGTVYAINVVLKENEIRWPFRLVSSHHMQLILDWMKRYQESDPSCVCLAMANWPTSYLESEIFFKHAKYQDGALLISNTLTQPFSRPPSINYMGKKSATQQNSKRFEDWLTRQKKKFEIKFHANFHVNQVSCPKTLSLKHFTPSMQAFLRYFYEKKYAIIKDDEIDWDKASEFLHSFWKSFQLDENIATELLSFEVNRNKNLTEQVVCRVVSVHEFRTELSNWLEKTGFTVDELIDSNLLWEYSSRKIIK